MRLTETAEPSDGELALRASAGDDGAFELIVRRYAATAIAVARRILPRLEDAEDAAQDAFVKIYRSLASYRGDRPMGGWIRTIVWRAAIDFTRRRHPERALTDYDLHSPSEERRQEHRDLLVRALERLSPADRDILLMLEADGRTVEEVSRTVGLSATAVRVRVHRARRKLKGWLRGGAA
jgi:RNA polymerase sigma-70 factor, ECF subfamily